MTQLTYPKPKYDKTVSIKLTEETLSWIQQESKMFNVPKSVVIRTILEEYIAQFPNHEV